ncbi:hypothetical protein LguiA_019239 [Lonicera macranthoides]
MNMHLSFLSQLLRLCFSLPKPPESSSYIGAYLIRSVVVGDEMRGERESVWWSEMRG